MPKDSVINARTIKSLIPIVILIITVTVIVLLININEVQSNVEQDAEEFKQSEPSFSKPIGYKHETKANPVHEVKTIYNNDTKDETEMTVLEKILDYAIFGVILIAIAVPSAFGIYLMYKFRKRMTLKWFFSAALGTVSVATTFLILLYMYWMFLNPVLGVPYSDFYVLIFILPISLIGGILVIFGVISKRSNTKIRNICLLFLSGLIAVFLVMVLHPAVLIPLIILLVVWDIYATRSKHGPIKGIIDIIDEDEAEKKKQRIKEMRQADEAARAAQASQAAQMALETGGPGANIPVSAGTAPPAPGKPSIKEVALTRTIAKQAALAQAQTDSQAPAKPPAKKEDDLEVLMLFGLYDTEEFSIGLGDLIFYSVFTAMVMMYFLYFLPFYGFYGGILMGVIVSTYAAIFIGIAVMVGFVKTLQLLEKNYILPGLPISMCIGLACFFIFLAVVEIMNKLFYGYFVPVF